MTAPAWYKLVPDAMAANLNSLFIAVFMAFALVCCYYFARGFCSQFLVRWKREWQIRRISRELKRRNVQVRWKVGK